MKKNSSYKLLIIFSLLFLFLMISNELVKTILNTDKLIYFYLSERMSAETLRDYFKFHHKWNFLELFFLPILFLIKITLISSALYIGTFFYSKVKVTFKQLFNAVVKAEFVFLLIPVIKIIWFYFFQTNYTLEDLQYFYPLSALNIVGYKGLEAWFIYPLQVLNLFELTYWLLLAYFIGKLAFSEKDKGKPMDLGFKIVMSSYGVVLLLWVVVVMFFTLNYS